MEGTVKTRANHYETLGISPTAASDEIAKAFARQTSVFRPHAFGGMTELFIAYETLRNPTKRRAYDASIGLGPKPDVPMSSPAPSAPAFMAAYPRPKIAVIHKEPPTEPTSAPSPRLPLNRTVSESAPVEAVIPEPRILPAADRPTRLAVEERFGFEAAPIEWKRAGMAVGVVVVAACVLGGVAGWWSSSDIGVQAQQQNAVSAPLLRAARATAAAELVAPIKTASETHPDRPRQVARVEPRATRAQLAQAEPQAQDVEAVEGASQPDALVPRGDEQAVAPEQAATPIASSMPLPKKLIARTIHRIGYSCGEVVAIDPMEGAAGVYAVNCSSGEAYQATPVNGRYRFRRLR